MPLTIGLVAHHETEVSSPHEEALEIVVGDEKDFLACWGDDDASVMASHEIDGTERLAALLVGAGAFDGNNEPLEAGLYLLLEAAFRLGQENPKTTLAPNFALID